MAPAAGAHLAESSSPQVQLLRLGVRHYASGLLSRSSAVRACSCAGIRYLERPGLRVRQGTTSAGTVH